VFAGMAGDSVPRRIVLIAPQDRSRLGALKEAGFTGYLIKPVRAASLKTRLTDADDVFDTSHAALDESPHAQPAAAGARKSLAILVAEDNEINVLLTRALLTRLGHLPTVVGGGEAALGAWRDARNAGAPFDLVLMDLHMPGLDGLEAARHIRAEEAEASAAPTPIVALTANAFPEDREACLAAGMDDFLVKPLDRDRLAAVLAPLEGAPSIAA